MRVTIAFLLLMHAPFQSAVAIELPGVVWTRVIGDDQGDHFASALAPARGGQGFWLGGTTRLPGFAERGAEFWIWRVDDRGEVIRRISLDRPGVVGGTNGGYPYVKSIYERGDGTLLVAVEYREHRSFLVTVDTDDGVVTARPVAPASSSAVVFDIVTGQREDLFLIGRADEVGYVAHFLPDRSLDWERTFSHEGRTLVFEGLSLAAGELVIVGSYGVYDAFGVGPSTLWVSHLDHEGSSLQEVKLRGRYGSIARLGREYLVVYDASEDQRQSIRLAHLDAQLQLLAEKELASSDYGSARFRIVRTADGHYAVAGALGVRLWAAGLDGRGELLWQFNGRPNDVIWAADSMTAVGAHAVLLSSVMSVTTSRQLSRDVGIVRFAP